MPSVCSGCGLRFCEGRCYHESPETTGCNFCGHDLRSDGWCVSCEGFNPPETTDTRTLADLRAEYGDPLTEVRGDPLLKRKYG